MTSYHEEQNPKMTTGRMTVESLFDFHRTPRTPASIQCPQCDAFPFHTQAELDQHVVEAHVQVAFAAPAAQPRREFVRPGRRREATTGQISYLRDLVAKKRPDVDEDYVEGVIAEGFDRVSKAIDKLKAMPDATATPAQPKVRVNRYAGKCEQCGKRVEAEAGRLSKADDGSWQVWHLDGDCPATEFPFPYGGYALDVDGEVKFYVANDEGFFAKASNDLWPMSKKGAEAIIAQIAVDPLEASKLYGRELEVCGRCGRDLTSEWRKVGIGPVCSQKGW